MHYAILILELGFPLAKSLKNKRSKLKPLINRLHKEFNISCSEVDKHDLWHESVVACAMISNDKRFSDAVLTKIPNFIQNHYPDVDINNYSIQFL